MAGLTRRKEIQKLLQERNCLTIEALSNVLRVSPSTIRRDLKLLENEGVVDSLYGGVVMRKSPLSPFLEREMVNAEEKRKIGVRAAQLVGNGAVVIIDGGTTATQVARAVAERVDLQGITVITPAINVARYFIERTNVRVFLTGGELRRESESMVGHLAEDSFRYLNAGFAFLSCGGLTAEGGVMYPDTELAELKKAIIRCSRRVVLVVDHSKFGRISAVSAFPVSEVDIMITDAKAPADEVEAIRREGVSVEIVE